MLEANGVRGQGRKDPIGDKLKAKVVFFRCLGEVIRRTFGITIIMSR